MKSESGGGVQGGSDSVGELEESPDDWLVTTKTRVWTGGNLVLCFICGVRSVREVDDESCEGPALIVLLGGACDARASRVDEGGRDHDEP